MRVRVTPFGNYTKRMIVSIYLVSIYVMTMSSTASSTNEFQSAHWMLSDFPITLLATTLYSTLRCSFGVRRAKNRTE